MTELVLNLLLSLYPQEWRSRYGGEVRDLIRELSAERHRSLVEMLPSLISGAAIERFHAFRRLDRASIAAALAATVVVLGGSMVMTARLDASRGPFPRMAPLIARSSGRDAASAGVNQSPEPGALFQWIP